MYRLRLGKYGQGTVDAAKRGKGVVEQDVAKNLD
jgi:hypothetical protein